MKLLRALPLLLFWPSYAGNGAPGADDPPASCGVKGARLHVVAGESLLATVNKSDAIASMSIWYRRLLNLSGDSLEPTAGRLEEVAGKERH